MVISSESVLLIISSFYYVRYSCALLLGMLNSLPQREMPFASTQYTGFAASKKVIDARRDELYSNGGDGDRYLTSDHVSQQAFENISEKRVELMKATLSYFPDTETLIVKIPTQPQEKAHRQLEQLILLKAIPMNLDINEFAPMSVTMRTAQNGSSRK